MKDLFIVLKDMIGRFGPIFKTMDVCKHDIHLEQVQDDHTDEFVAKKGNNYIKSCLA